MSGELIKERDSAYASQKTPLTLEHPLQVKGNNPFSVVDRYSSSIASCRDCPLAVHGALYVEPEQDLNSYLLQDKQQKQKESFLKRLSFANFKVHVASFFKKIKDTLGAWKDRVWDFFGSPKPSAPQIGSSTIAKKMETPAPVRLANNQASKTEKKEEVQTPPSLPIDDVEKKRIKEIEETLASYEAELEKSSGSMNAMMELACKMAILVGTLGYRYNKKEMKDYFDHLEVNIKKRVKTFEGGHFWTWFSVGLQLGSAVFSFGSFAGGFLGASTVGKVLTGLGNTTTPLGYLGQATSKLSDIDSEKKQAERTQRDYDGEKLTRARTEMGQSNEKTHQLMLEMMSQWRNMNQAHTESVKRAASAA